jgi:DUF4097 and DUF4098 domain-containing protein YvlB
MPSFETAEKISAAVELMSGAVRIVATDRGDTVVEVRPCDESHEADVKAAQQTRVEYAAGRLSVKGPKNRGLFGKAGSVEVSIELPTGSSVRGDAAAALFRCEGRIGECKIKSTVGDIQLQEAGSVELNTTSGDVLADRVAGSVEITTSSGAVRIREIDGNAFIRNSNGDTFVGEVTGELRLNGASGGVNVDSAQDSVDVRIAKGSIRIGEIVRGRIVLETAVGSLEIGIREGTAALLDVSTTQGGVRNDLTAADGPAETDERAEVRGRTSTGDILIHRAFRKEIDRTPAGG